MKRYQQILLVVLGLYGLYLIKTVMGIDISKRYTAWDVFKLPVKAWLDQPAKHKSTSFSLPPDHPIG